MLMKDCEYHKGKMYWLENDEREFKNLIKYENPFIVTFHDKQYPKNLLYRKFNNGKCCVNWVTKLNKEWKEKYKEDNRIGLHRFYHTDVSETYIKEYEKEKSPELILARFINHRKNNTVDGSLTIHIYDQQLAGTLRFCANMYHTTPTEITTKIIEQFLKDKFKGDEF